MHTVIFRNIFKAIGVLCLMNVGETKYSNMLQSQSTRKIYYYDSSCIVKFWV